MHLKKRFYFQFLMFALVLIAVRMSFDAVLRMLGVDSKLDSILGTKHRSRISKTNERVSEIPTVNVFPLGLNVFKRSPSQSNLEERSRLTKTTHQRLTNSMTTGNILQRPNIENVTTRTPLIFKTILLWTSFFRIQNYIPSLESQKCPESRCIITSDKNQLSQSEAIIFHHADINPRTLPMQRNPRQRWIYLNYESPANSNKKLLVGLGNKFNWTITYRFDSDFLLTPLPRPRKTPLIANDKDFSQNKTKMAAWFVSHCKTASKREDFVKELKKTIPIDVFGACGPKKCMPKTSTKCYEKIAKQYYFYLSFENSICKDYVTEKFLNALNFDMVPVVFGGADYAKVGPPGAYINAMDFGSPKELGQYLLDVANNREKYNKFFEWRRNYEMIDDPYACRLCERLHNPAEPSTTISNLIGWWYLEAQCTKWHPSFQVFKHLPRN